MHEKQGTVSLDSGSVLGGLWLMFRIKFFAEEVQG